MRTKTSIPLSLLALLALSACGGASGGTPLPAIPLFADQTFSGHAIDNQYFPLVPGTILTYEADTEDGTETVVIEVTNQVKVILGISCVVVHAAEYLDGELTEDTEDWFAQDDAGNVWYMGEYSEEIEDGMVVSTDGSWEAGVDGAEAGIIMLANPVPGQVYRQEYYAGVAEDMGTVIALGQTVQIDLGGYVGCAQIQDSTPLEPGVFEQKYYAPGVGAVLEVDEDGVRLELVDVQGP
jgi:hypothetical protein